MRSNRLKWLMGIAFVLLLLAIAAVEFVRSRYAHEMSRRVWPVAAPDAPPVIASGAAESSDPTLLLLGDSRIAEWGLPSIPNWRVVNAGMPGWTTGEIRLRTAALLDAIHPRVVVIEAGINDLKLLGVRPDLMATVVSLVESNLVDVADICRARKCHVVVFHVWPPGNVSLMRRVFWSKAVAESVSILNSRLPQNPGLRTNVEVVDLFSRAGAPIAPADYRDTLHIRPEVYRRLTAALENELKRLPVQRE